MDEKTNCPACGKRTRIGAFCEKCGKELPAATTPSHLQGESAPIRVPAEDEPVVSRSSSLEGERPREPFPFPLEGERPREPFPFPLEGERPREPFPFPLEGERPREPFPFPLEDERPREPQESGFRPQTADRRPQETDYRPQVFDLGSLTSGLRSPTTDHRPQASPQPEPPPAAVQSFCQDLKVEYNMAQVFVVGMGMPFGFNITPLTDGLTHINVTICSDVDGHQLKEQKRITKRAHKGHAFPLRMNLRPHDTFGGVVSFDIFVTYEKDGEIKTFEASTKHKVYPQNSNAREVVEHIIVNIHNEIKTGHAADVNLKNGLDGLSNLRNQTDANTTLHQLINRIADLPAAYGALELFPSDWEDEQGRTPSSDSIYTPESAKVEKLTLKSSDFMLHILTKDSITIGRNRDNDFVTRNFNRAGKATEETNGRISKYHCGLELHDDRCFIADGAFYKDEGITKAPPNRTFINGNPIPAKSSAEIARDAESRIGLAGADQRIFGAFIMNVTPVTCKAASSRTCQMANNCVPGRIAAVVIRRTDEIPEAFLLLARCADLGDIHPSMAGIQLWRKGDGIMAASGNHSNWLIPGHPLMSNGKRVEICEHNQFGL